MKVGGRIAFVSVLLGITVLALIALVAADGAQATITGKPFPSSGDWVIDTDTAVDGEMSLLLSGSVSVEPGYTLTMRGSVLTIQSSTPGANGIWVLDSSTDTGHLILDRVEVRADAFEDGWTFEILGEAVLRSSRFIGVFGGLNIFNDDVTVTDCVIESTGFCGVLIDNASPTISSTRINVTVASTGCGLEILGSPSPLAKPSLSDIQIHIEANTSLVATGASTTFRFTLWGLRSDTVDLGTVSDIEIELNASIDVMVTNAGNPRLYLYFETVGIQLDGGTSVDGFDNVTVRGDGFGANINYPGTRTTTLYSYNYFLGVSNDIDASGNNPDTVRGITVMDNIVNVNIQTTGTVNHVRTVDACAISWLSSIQAGQGGDLTFANLTIQDLEMDQAFRFGDDRDTTIVGCLLRTCYPVNAFLKVDSWNHDITLSGNMFTGNIVSDGAGALVSARKMVGDLVLDGNTFVWNDLGSALVVDAPLGDIVFTDNDLDGNNQSSDLVLLSGLGILDLNGLEFSNNSFTDNDCITTAFYVVRVEHPKQSINLHDNYFENDTADGIGIYMPYSDAATFPHPDFWFTVADNHFKDMVGYSIVFTNVDNSNIVVRGNVATGCDNYVLSLDQSAVYFSLSKHWGAVTLYVQGPDTLTVEDNEFAYNRGGGMSLRTSRFDPKYAAYSGNPYQEVLVRDNDLTHNGPRGWAIWMAGLFNKPTVEGNDMNYSVDGLFMSLVEAEASPSPFVHTCHGLVVDGGVDGSTAFGFEGVSATFYSCTFINYSHAIEVSNGEVYVLWSSLPVGSGYATDGRLTVYNHLEMLVDWANVDGVNSGMPVVGASVSLTTVTGQSIMALTTDPAGRTPATVVKVWESVDSIFNTNTPFRVALNCRGEYTEYSLNVERDYLGKDAALLILKDLHVPVLTVTSPVSGTMLSSSDVTLKGVFAESGSGIVTFEARHDAMAPGVWVPVVQQTLWSHVFSDLPDGSHLITLRAVDLANNSNEANVALTIDTVDPSLDCHPAFLDGEELPYDEGSDVYFAPTTPVLLVGTYSDDVTALEDITIRLNGVMVTALGGQLGKINFRVKLSEGMNLLILDATDRAGNRVTIDLLVTLDTDPPVLYVSNPLPGLEASEASLTVTGLTEPNMRLELRLEGAIGTRVYDHIDTPGGTEPILSLGDGTFSVDIELFEGIQVLIVSSTDLAGNYNGVEIGLMLDTEAPEFELSSPTAPMTITRLDSWTVSGSMVKEFNATILVNGQRITGTVGSFSVDVALHEGENEIEVMATDSVGNVFREVRTIVVDTIPPTLVMTFPTSTDLLTRVTTITMTGGVVGASATLGGKAGVFFDVKGREYAASLVSGTWDDGEWEYVLELGVGDLDQEITVTALDEAGNMVEVTIRVRNDQIPPSLAIDPPPSTTSTPTIYITGTTDSATGTVWAMGVAHPVVDGTFSIPVFLAPGPNTITLEVMDAAGNVQTDSVTIDLEWEPTGPEEVTESGGEGVSSVYAIALIAAGLTILCIAAILVTGWDRRDAE